MTTYPHLPDPSDVQWKPGAVKDNRCQALAYTDSRAVYAALDALGVAWSTHVLGVLPVGKEFVVTVALTIVSGAGSPIGDMTRTDVGQDEDAMAAQSRGLKRAAMQFGIFAGLWSLPSPWVDFDPAKKRIPEAGITELNNRYAAWYARHQAQQQRKVAA